MDIIASDARWVEPGQKNQRSARITDATWDRYKKLLCALYRHYTLLDVMNFMQLRYGFTPSKRQYGYRFEKWGIRKYNSGEKRSPIRPLEEMDNFLHEHEKMDDDFFSPSPRDFKNELTPTFLRIPNIGGGSHSPGSLSATSDNGTFFPDDGSELDAISSPGSPMSPIFYSLDRHEELKKLAADFCSAMSDDENAFRLYFDLYNTVSNKPGTSPAAKDVLAISCARAAEQTKNAQQASQLLGRHQLQHLGYDKTFLFSMLQAYMQERDDTADKATVQSRICDVIRGVLVNDTGLLPIPHGYYAIDLVTYQCLAHGLDVCEKAIAANGPHPTFSSDHILNSYVSKQPVAQRDSCFPLRSCVEWCSSQLSLHPTIPPELASIVSNNAQRLWRDNIHIFGTLWSLMLQDINHKIQLDWYDECEFALGINPSELLVTVSWMIGAQVGAGDIDVDVIERAAVGAMAMFQWSEGDLWMKFLRKFTWMNKLVDPNQGEKDFAAVVLDHVRQYISKALGINLPAPAQDPYALNYLDQLPPFSPNNDPDLLGSFGSLGSHAAGATGDAYRSAPDRLGIYLD